MSTVWWLGCHVIYWSTVFYQVQSQHNIYQGIFDHFMHKKMQHWLKKSQGHISGVIERMNIEGAAANNKINSFLFPLNCLVQDRSRVVTLFFRSDKNASLCSSEMFYPRVILLINVLFFDVFISQATIWLFLFQVLWTRNIITAKPLNNYEVLVTRFQDNTFQTCETKPRGPMTGWPLCLFWTVAVVKKWLKNGSIDMWFCGGLDFVFRENWLV